MIMMLPLFKEDKPHFHTSGGQLAVGFKIYTYAAGTDTPVQVYSDPSGATPYTNPIVLDGRGEPSGQGIYADPSLSYKVVLKTPEDAVVWSMDGVKCGMWEGSGGLVRIINKNSTDFNFSKISDLLTNGNDVVILVPGSSGAGYFTLSSKTSSSIVFTSVRDGVCMVLTLNSDDTSTLENNPLSVDLNVELLTIEQGWTELNDALDEGKEVLLKIGYLCLSLSYYQRNVKAKFVHNISADSNQYDYQSWELDSNGAWSSNNGYSKTAIIDNHTSFATVKSLIDSGVIPVLKVNNGSDLEFYNYCYGSGPFYFQRLLTDCSGIQPNPYATNELYRVSSDNSWTMMLTRPILYAERCAYDGDLNDWDRYYNTIRTQGNYLYKFKVPSDYSWTGWSMRTDAMEPQEGNQVSNATVIIDNSEFSDDVTLNFWNSDRSKTLKYSSSSGNIIHAGAVALIKIKGMFWTMDEFY